MVAYKINLRRSVSIALSAILLAGVFYFAGPKDFMAGLARFPFGVLSIALGLILVNQLTVVHRYRRILSHFGFDIPWGPIFRASVLGNLAALVVIPLMGHMIGRQSVLRHTGVTAVENAMIVAYERMLVALTSAAMAILGGIYLLGRGVFSQVENIPFVEIFLVLCIAWVLNRRLGFRRFERNHVMSVLAWRNAAHVLELLIITIISLAAMLSCFAVLFHVVAPDLSWLDLFAMAAIVSFGASIPLSFGGWGLREISAVCVLGLVGVPAAAALSASVLCGLLSILGVLLLAGVVVLLVPGGLWSAADSQKRVVYEAETSLSTEHAAAWFLYTITAVLIFFQVHITVAGTTVNLNMADPFAVLALSAVALDALSKRQWPTWNVPRLNTCLLVMWLALVFGLTVAWLLRGAVTGWAIGKVIGWAVLLGYLAAGYMAVHYYGRLGFRRLVEIVVSVLCVVVICSVLLTPTYGLGLPGFLHGTRTSGLEAYSGNRNALAFQILVVMALYLAQLGRMRSATSSEGWVGVGRLSTVALGVLIGGLLLTASRSAYITFALLAVASVALRVIGVRALVAAVLTGVAFWAVGRWFPDLLRIAATVAIDLYKAVVAWFSSGGVHTGLASLPSFSTVPLPVGRFSSDISDQGRWELTLASFSAWFHHPLFGGGLGSFLADSRAALGFDAIIHNTLLWLLAELGVVGAAPFVVALVLIVRSAWGRRSDTTRGRGVLLLMLVFAVMSLFQEVLYQRIFWLGLGALVAALPRVRGRATPDLQRWGRLRKPQR